jgi:hypothetical protein
MKTALLASVALLFVSAGYAAATPSPDNANAIEFAAVKAKPMMLADNDSDGGSDDNGSDSSSSDDSDDDNSSATSSKDDDGDDDSGSDDDVSKSSSVKKAGVPVSGRSKPRVPGASGCDDAADFAEHAECRN